MSKNRNKELINFNENFDDSTVILVGNESLKLPNGAEQLQEIIESYRQFREMTMVEDPSELAIEQPVDFLYEIVFCENYDCDTGQ